MLALSSLNSLIEVGVGLNLGFTLLWDIRRWIHEGFSRLWRSQVRSVDVALREYTTLEDKVIKAVIGKIEASKRSYEKFSLRIMRVSIVLAALFSVTLLFVLALVAGDGDRQVDSMWKWALLGFISFPMSVAVLGQSVLLGWYVCLLKWNTRGIDNLHAVMKSVEQSIDPTKPTPDSDEDESEQHDQDKSKKKNKDKDKGQSSE